MNDHCHVSELAGGPDCPRGGLIPVILPGVNRPVRICWKCFQERYQPRQDRVTKPPNCAKGRFCLTAPGGPR